MASKLFHYQNKNETCNRKNNCNGEFACKKIESSSKDLNEEINRKS